MDIAAHSLFSALAHETRLRCLMLLSVRDELCVCELTEVIGAAQPHVSRHLAHLRDTGLVSDRRDGLWIHYRLHPSLLPWVRRVLEETRAGIAGESPFADDLERLAQCDSGPGRSASC